MSDQQTKFGVITSAWAARPDVYTVAGDGEVVDISNTGIKRFSMSVTGNGAAATSWTAKLQGSLTGKVGSFRTLLTHTNTADGDGDLLSTSNDFSVRYFRSSVTAVVLGAATSITVDIFGTH